MVCCEAYNYLDNQLNNTYMKTTFNVEILGYEKSLYGGEDGHYCGTTVTPNKVCDFMELSEEYSDMTVEVCDKYVLITETRPYLYWNPGSYRVIQEPRTENRGIRLSKEIFDKIVFSHLGWTEYLTGHHEEYWKALSDIRYKKMTVKDLQEILK
jgi:hypothetical protein